jgi:hypothetical protein
VVGFDNQDNLQQGTGNRVESLLASGFVLKIRTSFILNLLYLTIFLAIKNPQWYKPARGSLVIRVHLPFNCSGFKYYAPEKFT